MNAKTTGYIKAVTAMLIFGTIGLFSRGIPLPAGFIAAVRGVIGTAFLICLVYLRGSKVNFAAVKKNLAVLIPSGICVGINWILIFEAYQRTTVAKAALSYYLAPAFVVIMSPLVLKERLNVKRVLCVAAALVGMVFVSGVLNSDALCIAELSGVLCGLGAAIFYAAATLLNKKTSGISDFDTTIIQLGAASAVLVPYALLTSDISSLSFSPTIVILLIVLGVVHTGIAFACFFGSEKDLSAQSVALISYIDPATAILISTVILHERMDVFGIIGAVMILGAAVIGEVTWRRRNQYRINPDM